MKKNEQTGNLRRIWGMSAVRRLTGLLEKIEFVGENVVWIRSEADSKV
ncbi:MAG: hypothetical protein H8D61_00800 [Deltaproteobacteria bacterium]|nr:hypothetical protein [Deltaproteobacteria bacterium]